MLFRICQSILVQILFLNGQKIDHWFIKRPKLSDKSPEIEDSNDSLDDSNSASKNIDSTESATTSVNVNENIESNEQNSNIQPALVSSNNNLKVPTDISRKGEDKKNQDFYNYTFKKQANGRSFQNGWVIKFPWIEYSKEKDAAFCYPCRQFGLCHTYDVFATTGYDKWQAALSAGKYFKKHGSSIAHINSVFSWKKNRRDQKKDVTILTQQFPRFFFWSKMNYHFDENWNDEENNELGLYQNLFKFSLENDEH